MVAHIKSQIRIFAMALAHPIEWTHGLIETLSERTVRGDDDFARLGEYYVDYSEPSEQAVNAVPAEMKAQIERSKILTVEGEI
jgi:hypothetical protein